MAKKKLRVTGDVTGAAFEDGDLNDTAVLTLKGTKVKPKVTVTFDTDHPSDTHVGIFTVLKAKGKVTWKYDLDNDDLRVQNLAAGEQIHETYTLRISAKGFKPVNKIVTVTINGADEAANNPPVITSDGGGDLASINVSENSTAVTTVTATDLDPGAVLTYQIIGGFDNALFSINSSTGALTFLTGHTVGAPADSDGNGVYEVMVNVSDGTDTDAQAISVHVVTNTAPTIFAPEPEDQAGISIQENTTLVTQVQAGDNEGDDITYSITGDDATLFTINPETGVLSFITAPDWEDPTSQNGGNQYFVTVIASDGSLSDDIELLVTVTNVNEAERTVIDVATLDPSEGFVIQGEAVGVFPFEDYSGASVSAADVNGDGFSDLIVGANGANNG